MAGTLQFISQTAMMRDGIKLTDREHQVDGARFIIFWRIIERPCTDNASNIGPHYDCESQIHIYVRVIMAISHVGTYGGKGQYHDGNAA
jgi:hypothetical protein